MKSDAKKFGLKSLRSKILIYAALPVMVMLTVVIALSAFDLYQDLRDSGLAKIDLERTYAMAEIERGNFESVTVPGIMALAQENGLFGKRAESLRYARQVLERYPQFTGSYFCYETNADQNDREFLQKATEAEKRACDANGRFIPYWFRDKQDPSLIRLNPLIDMETSFYYQGIKNRMLGIPETDNLSLAKELSVHYERGQPASLAELKTMVTEPYEYEGKLMVEQTYPVMINGKFVGIAGVDRALTQIHEFLQGLKPFRTADFILVSRRGRIIAATMDPKLNTKRIEDTPYADVLIPFYKQQSASGRGLVKDPASGQKYFYATARIKTGNWTVVMRVSEQEIIAPLWWTLTKTLTVSAAGLVVTLAILIWLANAVARRVATAARLASQVAEGDLTLNVVVSGSDETGTLLGAIRTMIQNLSGLLGQVKKSSIQLISTATQISSTAKSQEAAASDFSASTNEIAAAVKEISATAQELVRTLNEVTQSVNQTATLADAGRTSLGGLETTMRSLAEANSSISAKLSVISEKAKNINRVVTTITKVADQTNLLSLNAAIEAEKAGEYGLGFSVVAREIRRLADQTAVATLDIDQMVREMQTSVSAGVMEMDKFTDQVRRGVEAAGRISQQLGLIIQQVQELTPRFEAVNQGMRSQSSGAQQISEAMVHLTEAARTTAGSIQAFNQATADLHEAVRGLREEVARFKVEG